MPGGVTQEEAGEAGWTLSRRQRGASRIFKQSSVMLKSAFQGNNSGSMRRTDGSVSDLCVHTFTIQSAFIISSWLST